MPWIATPRSLRWTERRREQLGARLCPYTEPVRPLLEIDSHALWGTSACRRDEGGVQNAFAAGTAAFDVRAEGASLVVSTDPLGTCPIWFTRSDAGWLVSPEAKAIAAWTPVELRDDRELFAPGPRPPEWSPYPLVERLPPGARLRLTADRAVVEGSARAFDGAGSGARDRDWDVELGRVLVESYRPLPLPTGSFVSGGIDSSIACALACRHAGLRSVSSYSLGSELGDEFEPARILAEALGTRHHEVALDRDRVVAELERVVFQNEVFDGLSAEILLQLSALYGAAAGECVRVTTGYGSDLLFDGMLRIPAYLQAVGLASTGQLIERTRWTGELAPFVAWSRGIAAEHVFWDPAVLETALRVPRELCFRDGVEKHVLRAAAVRAGLLPPELAYRRKLGLTEGTGANRMLSHALGIEGPHGYGEKSAACARILRRVLSERAQ